MMRAPVLPTITPEVVEHIVMNLRPEDEREISAVSWDLSIKDRVNRYMGLEVYTFYASHNGDPAALIGAWPIHPSVWQVYAFGTLDFEKVAPTLTKFAMRFMTPSLINQGAHRAQCDSIEGHDKAHRWLEAMGYRKEGAMPKFGRKGETFYRFAYVTED